MSGAFLFRPSQQNHAARSAGERVRFIVRRIVQPPERRACLILDVQLKGLSGIELQERLLGEGRRSLKPRAGAG